MRWRRRSSGPARTVVDTGAGGRWPDGPVEALTVVLPHPSDLPRAVLAAATRTCTADLVVKVDGWAAPARRWTPPSVRVPGLLEQSVRVPAKRGGRLRVAVRTAEPVDAGVLLHAVLRTVLPHGPAPGPVTADVAAAVPLPEVAAPLVPFVSRLVAPDEPEDERVRATDVLVHADGATPPVPFRDPLVVAGDRAGDRALVLDQTLHTPRGRAGRHALPVATLHRRGDRHVLALPGPAGVVETVLDGPPGPEHLDALLDAGRCVPDDGVDLVAAAPLLLALAGTGLPVTVPASAVEPLVARGVARELAEAWASPSGDDWLGQTVDSVRQRRSAHREHGAAAVVRRAAAASGDVPAAPTVSAVLVTMRPERLTHALRQVARQRYPSLQLVLGLHGDRFDRATVDRAVEEAGLRDRTVVAPLGAELSFGSAVASAMTHADGALVTKLDDDDYYGPEHVWDLVVARDYSGARVVGKPPELVYLEGLDVTVHQLGYSREKHTPFVAGGTILAARADVEALGGWRPVPRSVDRGLLERFERAGAPVYATHGLGYVYVRHEAGHTWDPGVGHFLRGTGEQWSGLLAHPELGTDGERAVAPPA